MIEKVPILGRTGTDAASQWRRRFVPIGAGISLFAIYLLTSSISRNSRLNVDPLSALIPAWSLGQRGTLDIPEYLRATPWIQQYGDVVLSDRMPGIIFWAAPFYALLGEPAGPSVGVAALASVSAATLAIAVLYCLFTRVLEPGSALVAAALAAFGTATWTVSAQTLWPHGIDQLWLCVAMLMLAKERYWATGLAFSAAVLTRPHLAVAAAVCGLWTGVTQRSLRPILRIGITSSLGIAGLVAYNHFVFGRTTLLVGIYSARPDDAGQRVNASINDLGFTILTQVGGTFVSPVRGVLALSPFLLLLLPGLRQGWGVAPAWVRSSAVGGFAYMIVQLVGNGFTGGSYFYSYRLPIEMLTLAAPLLALAWREWTAKRLSRRIAFAVLATISIVQHAVGAFIFKDRLDLNPRAWSRSQVVEGLSQANSAELFGLGSLVAACGACAWVLILQHREPQDLTTLPSPARATERG